MVTTIYMIGNIKLTIKHLTYSISFVIKFTSKTHIEQKQKWKFLYWIMNFVQKKYSGGVNQMSSFLGIDKQKENYDPIYETA